MNIYFLIFIYFWVSTSPGGAEREGQSISRGEAERERETQNLKQAPGSELSAESQTQGSNSRIMRSYPELKSDT